MYPFNIQIPDNTEITNCDSNAREENQQLDKQMEGNIKISLMENAITTLKCKEIYFTLDGQLDYKISDTMLTIKKVCTIAILK